jgi:hypothetical protein
MEILFALVVFLVFFGALALGLILRGKPLQGSCGGAATLMGEKTCGVCGRDPNTCERQKSRASDTVSLHHVKPN